MLPCPACGFETVEDNAYGSYILCDVCGWEDDGVQLANPCSGGGANGESLVEAQEAALKIYPLQVDVAKGFRRSRRWRPVNLREVEIFVAQRVASHWTNVAIVEARDAYWESNHNSPLDTDATRGSA
jgi:hypothetical protein